MNRRENAVRGFGSRKEAKSNADVSNNREKSAKKAEKSILEHLVSGTALGLVGLIGYPLTIEGKGIALLFITLLISFASLITGFFTGTLFGIPKRNNDGSNDYALNNSLVEIADWLTKIIVGLGLVNLKQVSKYLLSIGEYVNSAIDKEVKSISVFTICVVVYFSVLGLYIGYNYMRLILSGKYKDADADLLRKEVQSLKQANDQLSNQVSKPEETEEIRQSLKQAAGDNADNYVDEMISKANQRLEDGLIENKEIDDPQKGMWGGKNEVNNRKLSAKVNTISEGNYRSIIKVESTDPVNNPLKDDQVILFALHNSWKPAYRLVTVKNEKAELVLFSYGSFTVGALADKGKTELELDLAQLPGVPKYFKEN